MKRRTFLLPMIMNDMLPVLKNSLFIETSGCSGGQDMCPVTTRTEKNNELVSIKKHDRSTLLLLCMASPILSGTGVQQWLVLSCVSCLGWSKQMGLDHTIENEGTVDQHDEAWL